MDELIVLFALIVVALIVGIPGVLFLRLFHRLGLPFEAAVVTGNCVIPCVIAFAMMRAGSGAFFTTPWWFLALNLVGGLLFTLAYFRWKR